MHVRSEAPLQQRECRVGRARLAEAVLHAGSRARKASAARRHVHPAAPLESEEVYALELHSVPSTAGGRSGSSTLLPVLAL